MPAVLGGGRFLRLVRSDDGWEWVERVNSDGVVVIVAVTPQDEILLVEQHRPPVGGRVIELPAGLAGDELGREELATAALRELEEETGYRAGRIDRLTGGPISAGLSSEVITFFRAWDLDRVGAGGGVGGEAIVLHQVPRAAVGPWLAEREAAGVQVDPKVYAGLWFLDRPRGEGSGP